MRSFGNQGEALWNSRAAGRLQFRPRSGQIANRAGKLAAAKFDRSGSYHRVPRHHAPLRTRSAIGGAGGDHDEGLAAIRATPGPHIVAFSTGHDPAEDHGGMACPAGRFWIRRFGRHLRRELKAAARDVYPQNYVKSGVTPLMLNVAGMHLRVKSAHDMNFKQPISSLRAKRSNPWGNKVSVDCFVASLLAMTLKYDSAISRRSAPESFRKFALSITEGAGKAGCLAHPQPPVQQKNTGVEPQVRREPRPSLRNGFNGFLRALPGDRALLSPSPRGYRRVAPDRADIAFRET